MLTYKVVTAEQYSEFLQLMLNEAADYLTRTMELMQMTLEQAQHLVTTVGQAHAIYQQDELAGFYWAEERGTVLHLHGLVLASQFQGQGIGTQVLTMLAAQYSGKMEAIVRLAGWRGIIAIAVKTSQLNKARLSACYPVPRALFAPGLQC